MRSKSEWSIAEAKQRFSELVRAVARGPQIIRNRERPVAALLALESYEEYLAWRRDHLQPTLEQRFAELRAIAGHEDYRLAIPARRDRPNPLVGDPDDLSG